MILILVRIKYILQIRKWEILRKWISHSLDRKSFFCWICIGFGFKDDQSIFVTGYSGVTKHFYDRIKEHEMSKTHINNLESFLMFESNKDIISYFSKAREIKLREIQNNKNILERVIETIKIIGKRVLVIEVLMKQHILWIIIH